MKKVLWLIVCLMTMVLSVNAQEFNYNKAVKTMYSDTYAPSIASDVIKNPNVALAGDFLRKSANCEAIALGCAVASGALIAYGANCTSEKNKSSDKNKYDMGKCLIGAGIVCGVASLTAYILHVDYKWKSGKTLELCGTKITYNF